MHTLGPGLFEKIVRLELPIGTYIFYIDVRRVARDILKIEPECTETLLDSLTTRNYATVIDRGHDT